MYYNSYLNRKKQEIQCHIVNYFGHLLSEISNTKIWDTSISGFRNRHFGGATLNVAYILWRVRPFTMRIDNAWVTLISVLYWHILSNRRLISYRVQQRLVLHFRSSRTSGGAPASVAVPPSPHSVYPRLSCIQRMSSCLHCAKTFLVFFSKSLPDTDLRLLNLFLMTSSKSDYSDSFYHPINLIPLLKRSLWE